MNAYWNRAATDLLFLAASIPARAGQSRAGTGLRRWRPVRCLNARGGLALTGVEDTGRLRKPRARAMRLKNKAPLSVTQSDLRALPPDLRTQRSTMFMANPPYYAAHGPAAQDAGCDRALRERHPLADWLNIGCVGWRDGGHLTFIHLTERFLTL